MDLIDIHSHILPGLGDGSRDLKQSLAMAEAAVNDGISLLVATPRIGRGTFVNHREGILENVRNLNQCLKYARINLPVLPGAEYCLEADLPKRLAAGQVLTLNDTGRYLLVELPAEAVTEHTVDLLQTLQLQGVTPIIANPEGNPWLAKNPEILKRLVDQGILAQITSGSLTGLFGRRIKKAALMFLQFGQAQLIASDSHMGKGRKPGLYSAFQVIEYRWGLDFARNLTCRNPNMIIKGMPLKPELPPEPKRAWRIFSNPFPRQI